LPSPLAVVSRHRRARTTQVATALLTCSLLALTGCGSSSHDDGTEADPAIAVPAATPLYLGATVRPSGSQLQGALAAGKELTGQADPYLRLLAALQTPGSPKLDFKRDVASWLGPHVGVFLSSLASAGPLIGLVQASLTGKSTGDASSFPFAEGHLDGAIVMDTSNSSGARAFLAGQAKLAGAKPKRYRGVSYEATADGLAFGLVGHFAVIGSESALRGVVDTDQGESSLAKQTSYATLVSKAPAQALAHLFVNPAAASAEDRKQPSSSGVLALVSGDRPANLSAIASSGSLSIDADTLAANATSPGVLSGDPKAAQTLAELPGESWLGIGLGELGPNLSRDVEGLQSLASLAGTGEGETPGTLSLQSLLSGLLTPLRTMGAGTAQTKRDYARWMGPASVFASGAGLLELKAAIVIASTDPTASRAAVGKLGAALRKQGDEVRTIVHPGVEAEIGARITGLPLELVIADGSASDGQTKFVLGLGEASVPEALEPSSTLSAAASYTAAAAALGESIKPSVMLDIPTLLSLLEGVGLTEGPSIAPFLPYLKAAGTLDGGGRELGGGIERFRIVLGLHQAG
jgi:hypothetical protein